MTNNIRRCILAVALTLLVPASSNAQDMMGLDATSDAFTKSEITRESIVESLAQLVPGAILDLKMAVTFRGWTSSERSFNQLA
jgi:hypothetical protein